MWRMLFLILVLLGALAVLLAVVLGIGVAKVAMVNSDIAAPGNATTQGVQATAVEPGANPSAGATTLPAAAKVIPDAYVPGTITLRGADARIYSRQPTKKGPEGDLVDWSSTSGVASWSFTPSNSGKYRVLVTRANGPGSGGDFAVLLNEEPNRDPAFIAKAAPTGGWDQFKTEFAGTIDLSEQRTTLAIRPLKESATPLMSLRQIQLVPEEGVVPKTDGEEDKEENPRVTGLTLINAKTGKPIGALTTPMAIDLGPVPISIQAETSGGVGSVQFVVNGKKPLPPQSEKPYTIANDTEGRYEPWKPELGKYTIEVTPYSEAKGAGEAGKKHIVYVSVRSSIPISLEAKDAKLRGEGLKLEEGSQPVITSWTKSDQSLEWNIKVPRTGSYTAEVTYSAEKGQGGDFIVQAGDLQMSGKAVATGDLKKFERTKVGAGKLNAGEAKITIKPIRLAADRSLMNFRELRLTLVGNED